MSSNASIWSDAISAAVLFAVDPSVLGGVHVRASAGMVRDRWLDVLRSACSANTPLRKLPPSISDERLLGGIDLAATLKAGRPIVVSGLLAETNGGILLAVMAERLSTMTAARLNGALDAHEIVVEREGLSQRLPASLGVVAFDEGFEDEQIPESLRERLAFSIDLTSLARADMENHDPDIGVVEQARHGLRQVTIGTDGIEALCHTAVYLGVGSLRAPLLAVRAARAAAALDGAAQVQSEHLKLAARLVLAPRANALPQPAQQTEQCTRDEERETDAVRADDAPLEDVVLEAAQAALPLDLLKRLQNGLLRPTRKASAGRQGMAKVGPRRGRPIGVRRGEVTFGARLNVLETLRAAAPWQEFRRRESEEANTRLLIHKEDFRITRFKQNSATSTIFVVDASGSSALQRLAEVKGAVELLLADCYVRRDEVALIAFRGERADLLLPPTRSLARVKRSLAALPGGGGTPLSAAIIAATSLALGIRNRGHSPTIVLMTDGRANVCRDGSAGRAAAEAEAWEAARQLHASGVPAVVIDTSARPQPQAARIAEGMSARYVALPYADAARLSRAVQANIVTA